MNGDGFFTPPQYSAHYHLTLKFIITFLQDFPSIHFLKPQKCIFLVYVCYLHNDLHSRSEEGIFFATFPFLILSYFSPQRKSERVDINICKNVLIIQREWEQW